MKRTSGLGEGRSFHVCRAWSFLLQAPAHPVACHLVLATCPMLPPPLPSVSHVFVESEDTTGQAVQRRLRLSLTTSTAVMTAYTPSVSATQPWL